MRSNLLILPCKNESNFQGSFHCKNSQAIQKFKHLPTPNTHLGQTMLHTKTEGRLRQHNLQDIHEPRSLQRSSCKKSRLIHLQKGQSSLISTNTMKSHPQCPPTKKSKGIGTPLIRVAQVTMMTRRHLHLGSTSVPVPFREVFGPWIQRTVKCRYATLPETSTKKSPSDARTKNENISVVRNQ